jgi:hypothetical protein
LVGFDATSRATGLTVKSLMRMFSLGRSQTARTLFALTRELQEASEVVLEFRRAAHAGAGADLVEKLAAS